MAPESFQRITVKVTMRHDLGQQRQQITRV